MMPWLVSNFLFIFVDTPTGLVYLTMHLKARDFARWSIQVRYLPLVFLVLIDVSSLSRQRTFVMIRKRFLDGVLLLSEIVLVNRQRRKPIWNWVFHFVGKNYFLNNLKIANHACPVVVGKKLDGIQKLIECSHAVKTPAYGIMNCYTQNIIKNVWCILLLVMSRWIFVHVGYRD